MLDDSKAVLVVGYMTKTEGIWKENFLAVDRAMQEVHSILTLSVEKELEDV